MCAAGCGLDIGERRSQTNGGFQGGIQHRLPSVQYAWPALSFRGECFVVAILEETGAVNAASMEECIFILTCLNTLSPSFSLSDGHDDMWCTSSEMGYQR